MRRFSSVAFFLLLLTLGVAEAASAVEMHAYGRPFCEGAKVRDYEAPFDALPAIRHVRLDEDLPFGPRNMSIYQSAFSRVIVGEGGFGYGFFDETYGIRKKVDLDWDVETTLSRIDRRGEVLGEVASEDQYFGVVTEIDEMSFWLDAPPGPALYRYDIEFREHGSGKVLGSYSEYLRVVKPTFHAGIAINRLQFEPGQEAFARVENRGTSWIQFGLAYEVQKFEGGRWVAQPFGSGVWPAVGLILPGGYSGWCMRYQIPSDASPGRYRFLKGLGFWGRRGGKRAVAAFRVGA